MGSLVPTDDGVARLAVAVSGGGDSVALLHILSRCFDPEHVQIFAATVDHGLRPESTDEAKDVARLAAGLGIEHSVLSWTGWDGTGNLQDQARKARYSLLCNWAKAKDIPTLLLGHTANDQAETVLMRLGRAAGVDGLAAIPERRVVQGVTVVRPIMGLTRADLRAYLIGHGIAWVDDPSNDDLKYDRIKARRALEQLESLGITADGLSEVAQNMTRARQALDWYCFIAAREMACIDGGNVVVDLRKFRTLPEETARRLLIGAITWISGSLYPPRRVPTLSALSALREGHTVTLGGCHAIVRGHSIWLCREFNAVRGFRSPLTKAWDQRWLLSGPAIQGCEVRALGKGGLLLCPDWRETGCPDVALTGSPSLWKNDVLVAAPFAGWANGYHAELIDGTEGFFLSLLSH